MRAVLQNGLALVAAAALLAAACGTTAARREERVTQPDGRASTSGRAVELVMGR